VLRQAKDGLGVKRGGAALIAILPMYDFPCTAAANDELWASISARLAEAGVQASPRLTRDGDLAEFWRNPGLVFGQTCGYPYVTALKKTVTLVAAPEYSFPGCESASHRSFIIRRATDSRIALNEFCGAIAALNAHDSNTGMNLFRASVAPIAGGKTFFSAIVLTGSHEASVAAVAEGEADLASIDCVSFALLGRGRPELIDRVAIVAESPLSPCLPFIASANLTAPMIAAVREALFEALADPDLAETRATLGLTGARIAAPADYDRVMEIEREAAAMGYAELA
jgi:ABC-type phosphate/phosphonate transport system substrate-binding protein